MGEGGWGFIFGFSLSRLFSKNRQVRIGLEVFLQNSLYSLLFLDKFTLYL